MFASKEEEVGELIKQQACKRWQHVLFPFPPMFVAQEQVLAEHSFLEQGQKAWQQSVQGCWADLHVSAGAFRLCRSCFARQLESCKTLELNADCNMYQMTVKAIEMAQWGQCTSINASA